MPVHEPTPLERFLNGILPENPVYRQLLGLCPTLAVTAAMKPAMTMVGATAFVLICANLITSLIRHLLKPHLRILVFTLTIATFVTIADRTLAAFAYPMSKLLGPYVPLIIVNCMIISRCEVCSSKQGPKRLWPTPSGSRSGFCWRWPAWPPCVRFSATAPGSDSARARVVPHPDPHDPATGRLPGPRVAAGSGNLARPAPQGAGERAAAGSA